MSAYDVDTAGFSSPRYLTVLRKLRRMDIRDLNVGYEPRGYWVAPRHESPMHSGYHTDPATAVESLLEKIETRKENTRNGNQEDRDQGTRD